ncbi:beta-mannosidase [Marinilabilia salmonicolor]|uniref:beta-mannosidase n=1 Tax=Marinilabilia salmonicolor TaxID=989 RepID=UPI00131F428B|nr:glycoside hydrolase family 2 TIM barrel-domain containing protein [Marinilabilia salmonicolor]
MEGVRPSDEKDNQLSFQQVEENKYLIEKGWKLSCKEEVQFNSANIFNSDYSTTDWYDATVPGTVLTTLLNEGVYADPYYGLNNLLIPDSLSRMEWVYRLSFKLPKGRGQGERVWLDFSGINYEADFILNSTKLGGIKGAFKQKRFDVTEILRNETENVLVVNIKPPRNPGIPHEQSELAGRGPNGGQLCLDGPTFISSEGWDWIPGIRDRNIGIWQNVYLEFTGDVTTQDIQVITDLTLPDTTRAEVSIYATLLNHSNRAKKVRVLGKIEEVEVEKMINLKPFEKKNISLLPDSFPDLKFKNPRLWWPNGYGNPELYSLKLHVFDERSLSDVENVRFGIREFSYELGVSEGSKIKRVDYNPLLADGEILFDNVNRVNVHEGTSVPTLINASSDGLKVLEEDSENPFFTIKVNGVPIFIRGGNWGMDDGMKRVSRERLEPYFQLHETVGFNMIRNWTGESTQKSFYELADEYGMLIWNDFWLSTEGYNLNVNDYDLFMENATDVVKRYRNHPSIVVWCPRNEGFAPEKLEKRIIKMISEEDESRHYIGNSRNLNLKPSGPWDYVPPVKYYDEISGGFSTEVGTPSLPTAASMRKFIPEADQWPISDTWHYHDFHRGQPEYVKEIRERFGKSSNLDEFAQKAQFINYESYRALFESWNSKMWDNASGVLLWMSHPAWPSMVWQTYSWDYEAFGSYYGSKAACEPFHIQRNEDDGRIVAINSTRRTIEGVTARMKIIDLNGEEIFTKKKRIDLKKNDKTDCFQSEKPDNLPGVYLLRLELFEGDDRLSVNEYWQSSSDKGRFKAFNDLSGAAFSGKIESVTDGTIGFTIENISESPALNVKFNLRDKTSNEIQLPAIFTEGYFTLFPGESRFVELELNDLSIEDLKITVESYNNKTQALIAL